MQRSIQFLAISIVLTGTTIVLGQKGIDTQTEKIKETGNQVTTRSNDATRSFDFGKGKTKVRELLPNPYKLNSRRDVLLETIANVLREQKIVIDEQNSRLTSGIIVTQPFIFAKGAVITQSELGRLAILDGGYNAWTKAQYTLTIEVQSIDGIQNNVSVTAKIEGRAGNGLSSEWITVRSAGKIEDEILAKLVEAVTGNSPDPVQDTGN